MANEQLGIDLDMVTETFSQFFTQMFNDLRKKSPDIEVYLFEIMHRYQTEVLDKISEGMNDRKENYRLKCGHRQSKDKTRFPCGNLISRTGFCSSLYCPEYGKVGRCKHLNSGCYGKEEGVIYCMTCGEPIPCRN